MAIMKMNFFFLAHEHEFFSPLFFYLCSLMNELIISVSLSRAHVGRLLFSFQTLFA